MTRPALVFDDVSFTYPDGTGPALDAVSFELPEGCFALVTGPTGAGKSTLLRAVNGLVPHFTGGRFAGRVIVEGRSTLDHAPRELADAVGFVPQDPGSSFVLDRVEDELAYAMENLALPQDVMRRRVEEALDLLGLDALRDRSVRTISGGERQRVAIAAALTAGPRVLALDEPTSQLDPQGAEDVLAALQRLVHDLGMTVVLSEHRLERVAGFADVAIGCSGGGRVTGGEPAAVLDELGAGPPVARVARGLGWDPAPLTVREARRRAPDEDLGPIPGTTASVQSGRLLLQARALRASYGPTGVLRGVDLDLRVGERVALVGRNGSGKTTLLRCLTGLHQADAGEIRTEAGPPLPGRDVALCPQVPEAVLFRDRVVDEVQTTIDALRRDADAVSLLDELGLGELADRHPRDLSAGQRLLVAVAAMVATGAPVLLLDEPTRGLDPESKARLVRLLRRYCTNRAAMFATHDVEMVAEVATRVVMLAGGEVIADGNPSTVLGDSHVFAPQMARVFGPGWLTPEQVIAAAARRAASARSSSSSRLGP